MIGMTRTLDGKKIWVRPSAIQMVEEGEIEGTCLIYVGGQKIAVNATVDKLTGTITTMEAQF